MPLRSRYGCYAKLSSNMVDSHSWAPLQLGRRAAVKKFNLSIFRFKPTLPSGCLRTCCCIQDTGGIPDSFCLRVLNRQLSFRDILSSALSLSIFIVVFRQSHTMQSTEKCRKLDASQGGGSVWGTGSDKGELGGAADLKSVHPSLRMLGFKQIY